MSAVAFDTLKLARDLRDRGRMTPEQAEGVADALAQAFRDEVATKRDLADVKRDLMTEIGRVESELRTEIGRVESELRTEIGRVESALKADISRVERDLKAEIQASELRMSAKIGEVKYDLLRWLIPLFLAQTAATATLVKLL